MAASSGKPQAYLYQYDQLNRLVQASSFEGYNTSTNVWDNTSLNSNYKESLSYDGNGNILTLRRYDASGAFMGDLTYKYNTVSNGFSKNTNKLGAAQDAVTTSGIADDIENGQVYNTSNHTLDNCAYDNIGNLTKDEQEQIADIKWTAYGKIKEIIRTSASTKPDLEFAYDASGNRVGKTVKTKASAGVLNASNLWSYYYYLRDAQGNTMAVYEKSSATSGALTLIEQHLYGSSRMGVLTRSEDMGLSARLKQMQIES